MLDKNTVKTLIVGTVVVWALCGALIGAMWFSEPAYVIAGACAGVAVGSIQSALHTHYFRVNRKVFAD